MDSYVLKGEEEYEDITGDFGSLGELIIKKLTDGGNKVIFINGSTGEHQTFADVKRETLHVASCMRNYGIEKDDVVVIISENRFEVITISLATILLGAILAPLNFAYKKFELENALKILGRPKLLFVSGIAGNSVTSVIQESKIPIDVVALDGGAASFEIPSFERFLKSSSKPWRKVELSPVNVHQKVAVILFSSGTTGLPKGVQITHANIMVLYQDSFALKFYMKATYGLEKRTLTVAPWFHAMGFVTMFLDACSDDSTSVFLPQFNGPLFLECIQKFKINLIGVVPPLLVFLTKTEIFDNYDLSSLKEIACRAGVITLELENAVKKRFKNGVSIRQAYGMTETTLAVIKHGMVRKPGSIGSLIRGVEAKVIDDKGRSLPAFQNGELCFKGSRIMKGYLGNDEATRNTIDEDGWLHSGDIGYYDEDQLFYIVDRKKELIKYNAYQVPPAEIESLLITHPKIRDAGVIGIPDEISGEKALAFIAKQPDVHLTESEVIQFVAENLSKQKQLHGGIRFVEEIPRNMSGKILRKDLKEMFKVSLKSKL